MNSECDKARKKADGLWERKLQMDDAAERAEEEWGQADEYAESCVNQLAWACGLTFIDHHEPGMTL
jgi:hypothetical protein